MASRTAASVGVVAAGLAIVAAALALTGAARWAGIAVAGAGAIGFSLRRHGTIDRPVAAAVAGLAGAGLVGLAVAVGSSDAAAVSPAGAGGVAVGGLLVLLAGYADWRALPRDRALRTLRAALLTTAVGAGGFAAIQLWGILLATGYVATGRPLAPVPRTVISTVAVALGAVTAAGAFFTVTDHDRSFVDLVRPGRRAALYVVGGVVALLGLNLAIGVLFDRLGIDSPQHSVIAAGQSEPAVLLVMIPLSYLLIGPGEELLFRNLAQKPLYELVPRRTAIVLSSAVFAALHFNSYAGPDSGAVAVGLALGIVFALSLVLGWIYHRTENVVVPAVIHGTFNAVGFAIAYVQVTGVL